MNWYVIHVLSGHEQKIKTYIENTVRNTGVAEKIGQVLVPTQEILGLKAGKKVTSIRKILPSYILLEMEMDDESWSFINDTPGVTGFIGSSKRPLPLRKAEVERIMKQIENKPVGGGEGAGPSPFNVGDSVKVTSGPFSDFSGVVEQVTPEKSKVKVVVSIFGRPTPIELDFLQIQMAQPGT